MNDGKLVLKSLDSCTKVCFAVLKMESDFDITKNSKISRILTSNNTSCRFTCIDRPKLDCNAMFCRDEMS